jgi:hypothetical protein
LLPAGKPLDDVASIQNAQGVTCIQDHHAETLTSIYQYGGPYAHWKEERIWLRSPQHLQPIHTLLSRVPCFLGIERPNLGASDVKG